MSWGSSNIPKDALTLLWTNPKKNVAFLPQKIIIPKQYKYVIIDTSYATWDESNNSVLVNLDGSDRVVLNSYRVSDQGTFFGSRIINIERGILNFNNGFLTYMGDFIAHIDNSSSIPLRIWGVNY